MVMEKNLEKWKYNGLSYHNTEKKIQILLWSFSDFKTTWNFALLWLTIFNIGEKNPKIWNVFVLNSNAF